MHRMVTLLTWSDRGTSPHPAGSGRPSHDLGPVRRLVEEPESRGRYHRAMVLVPQRGAAAAEGLCEDLRARIPQVDLQVVDLDDPSDYAGVFRVVRTEIERAALSGPVDVILSAGTPQMQAIWLILVEAGFLAARMLQVIPPFFVPNPHPKAIKEVRLDFEGFPEVLALRQDLARLRTDTELVNDQLVGTSPPMLALKQRMAKVARAEVPVIIHGETGTGKDLVARFLHATSVRAHGPFLAENCGGFNETMLSSELFGHEQGAFTGAHQRRRGLFELAHGGTLFLDEVAELSPAMQASLLRVLQDGTIRRVGGEEFISVDVRLICATHRNLERGVDKGKFRQDLYYRLKGAVLTVPPLRDRPGDIPLLVEAFLADHAAPPKVSGAVLGQLANHAWPGNVRQLRAEVVRWTVFCDKVVRVSDMAPELRGTGEAKVSKSTKAVEPDRSLQTLGAAVAEAERRAILVALEHFDGNLTRTARSLAVDRNTLKRKLKKLGLTPSA